MFIQKLIKLFGNVAFLYTMLTESVFAISGGTLADDPKWDFALAIESENGLCSGTLLNTQYILTAAHCVVPGDYSVFTNRRYIGNASLVYIDPEYDDSTGHNDIAVLRLNSPTTITPHFGKLISAEQYAELLLGNYFHEEIMTIGYGLDNQDKVGTRKIVFLGHYEVATNVSPHFAHHVGTIIQGETKSGGYIREGDSGGGVYFLTDESPLLGAVNSFYFYLSKTEGLLFVGNDPTQARKNKPRRAYAAIVPSLCRADKEIQDSIAFNGTECDLVFNILNDLSNDLETATAYQLLLMRRHAGKGIITYPDFRYIMSLAALSKGASIGFANLDILDICAGPNHTYSDGTKKMYPLCIIEPNDDFRDDMIEEGIDEYNINRYEYYLNAAINALQSIGIIKELSDFPNAFQHKKNYCIPRMSTGDSGEIRSLVTYVIEMKICDRFPSKCKTFNYCGPPDWLTFDYPAVKQSALTIGKVFITKKENGDCDRNQCIEYFLNDKSSYNPSHMASLDWSLFLPASDNKINVFGYEQTIGVIKNFYNSAEQRNYINDFIKKSVWPDEIVSYAEGETINIDTNDLTLSYLPEFGFLELDHVVLSKSELQNIIKIFENSTGTLAKRDPSGVVTVNDNASRSNDNLSQLFVFPSGDENTYGFVMYFNGMRVEP